MINLIPRLKSKIKAFTRIPRFLTWKMLGRQKKSINTVIYIIEDANWVIKWEGYYISNGVNSIGICCKLDTNSYFYFNSIIHFGSVHTFIKEHLHIHSSNKVIVTFYHGNRGIDLYVDKTIDKILAFQNRVSRFVVSTSIMKERMISWGIPEEKLILIPIGVDLSHFRPFSFEKIKKLRNGVGIPNDTICIGSFQKDGNGWGEGLEPKWIKGPDIFVKVVSQIAKKRKIHCLLTGPARGYVKRELEIAGVTFTHRFLKNYFDIVDYYNCLDLYLVTSREEGGPKALMESMATGIPLISTKCGMAPDMIVNSENGLLVDIEDSDGIIHCTESILDDRVFREKLIHNGFKTIKKYDWKIIARQYAELYRTVISEKICE